MLPQFQFAVSVVSGAVIYITTNQIELTPPVGGVSVIKHDSWKWLHNFNEVFDDKLRIRSFFIIQITGMSV